MTWVRVELMILDQSRRKNDAFTHSATLPIKLSKNNALSCAMLFILRWLTNAMISTSVFVIFIAILGAGP